MGREQVSSEVARLQKLQSCEIALGEGIHKNNLDVIRWLTSEILHFQSSWMPVITAALLDKSKAGEYRWRIAKNPLGLVRSIAKRIALKDYPELIFGNNVDKVLNPNERAVSTLRVAPDGQTSTYADREGEVIGTGYWHDEFIDKATFEADDYSGPEDWEKLDSTLNLRRTIHSLLIGTKSASGWDYQKIKSSS